MNTEQEIKKWLDNAEVPEYLKEELRNLSDQKIADAFCKEISFGTAGMRGIIGPGPNCMNELTVKRATIGYGLALKEVSKSPKIRVIIAHDNRHYSKEFTDISAAVLNEMGIDVYVFDELRPTPLLSFAIRYFGVDGGIMITASHNPKEYNGYKVYDENGCQLTTEYARLVMDKIALNDILPPYKMPDAERRGKLVVLNSEAEEAFLKRCKEVAIHTAFEPKGIKIVFSPQHGTSAKLGVRVLEELGYDVYPVEEQMSPDPDFSNTITPNPEKPEAYIASIELAKKVGADIILTTDPDADRVGFAYRNKEGDYTLLTGNETGALLIQYIFHAREEEGLLPKQGGLLLQSIVTSSLGSRIARSFNVETRQFLTGFKYIGSALDEISKNNPQAFQFGYEESYGYIFEDICRDKDSIEALVMIAEMSNHYHLCKLNIDDVLEDIYEKYGFTYNRNIEFNFSGADACGAGAKLDILRSKNPTKIGSLQVVKVEDYERQISYDPSNKEAITVMVQLPKENVLKYYLEDGSWIAIRPSGTEPKIKFYYECVGSDKDEVKAMPALLHHSIEELLNN